MRRMRGAVSARWLLAHLAIAFCFATAVAIADGRHAPFLTQGRWEATATGQVGPWGDGLTLTWSIVPDGTIIPASYPFQGERTSPSDFVAAFDATFGSGGGAAGDLTQRPWFWLVNQSLNRWSQLSGLEFVYEPADDGAQLVEANAGQLGVRGDLRVGGHLIDGDPRLPGGAPAGNFLGYGFFPSNGDFVLDTANLPLFADTTGQHLILRNTLMHEFGHALGLAHIESDTDPNTPGPQLGSFLMEPALTLDFDGPQLDDVLGIHRLYGDRFEKGVGNDRPADPSPLGLLSRGESIVVGANGDSLRVQPSDVDFVSISDASDVDVFALSLATASRIAVSLEPLGAPYELFRDGQFVDVDPRRVGDLALELVAADGATSLAAVNDAGAGQPEHLRGVEVGAGQLFVRVSAAAVASPQLYRLEITAVPEPGTLVGIACWVAFCTALRHCQRRACR